MMTLAFLNIGTSEMVVILIVALLLFGGKKLPELARGLGRGIREFKDASDGIKREISDQINNFERDLDVDVEDKTKTSPVVDYNDSSETGDVASNNDEQDGETEKEKKFPDFSTPENTYQHNPGGHPVDEDAYYNYGYNDHFDSDATEETDGGQEEREGGERAQTGFKPD